MSQQILKNNMEKLWYMGIRIIELQLTKINNSEHISAYADILYYSSFWQARPIQKRLVILKDFNLYDRFAYQPENGEFASVPLTKALVSKMDESALQKEKTERVNWFKEATNQPKVVVSREPTKKYITKQ